MIPTNNNKNNQNFIYLNNLISFPVNSPGLDNENQDQSRTSLENDIQEIIAPKKSVRVDIDDLIKNPSNYQDTDFLTDENYMSFWQIGEKNNILWLINKCNNINQNEINEVIKNLPIFAEKKNSHQIYAFIHFLYKKRDFLRTNHRIQLTWLAEQYQLIDLKLFLTQKITTVSESKIFLPVPDGKLSNFEKESLSECLSIDNKWHKPEIELHYFFNGIYFKNDLNQILITSRTPISMTIEAYVNLKELIDTISQKNLNTNHNSNNPDLTNIFTFISENASLESLSILLLSDSPPSDNDIDKIEEEFISNLNINNTLREKSSIEKLDLTYNIIDL